MTRPLVTADLLAALIAAAPERVTKKLDARPRVADEWAWTFGDVVKVAAGTETVTLSGTTVTKLADVSCTCLLQPRCFHLLAVVSVLEVERSAEPTLAEPRSGEHPSEAKETLTAEQRGTATEALKVGSIVLTHGLTRVSTLRIGDLVRVAHACRKHGLPRLEGAVMGVFDAASALRKDSPDFTLEEGAGALAELLLVATMLLRPEGADWVGVARRAYREVSPLKLAGLATKPVLAKGYAGVVTYFTDGDRVFVAQEVLPGDDERAVGAYDSQLRFGEVSLSHRRAAQAGLVFATARLSADDRLGAGKDVTCAVTTKDGSLVARLFDEPVSRQLTRVDKGERHGLVFLRGRLGPGALMLAESRAVLPTTIPIDHPRFGYRENLSRLAEVGAEVRLIGQLGVGGLAIDPIAVSVGDGPWLNLAFERMAKATLPSPHTDKPVALPAEGGGDALEPFRRRLRRFALMGEPTLPSAALPEVHRECARLRAAFLPVAADALELLATRARGAPEKAAEAWLTGHTYCQAARASIARSAWGLSSE